MWISACECRTCSHHTESALDQHEERLRAGPSGCRSLLMSWLLFYEALEWIFWCEKKSPPPQPSSCSTLWFSLSFYWVCFPIKKIFHLRLDDSLRASFVLWSFALQEELTRCKVCFHQCRCCWCAVCLSFCASLWSLPINVKSFRVPSGSLSDRKSRLKAFPSICLLSRSLPSLSSYGNCRAKSSGPLLCRSIRSSHEM